MGPGGAKLARPSRFWRQLSAEHQRDLDRFGPDYVKRRQALRYFTWRWTWFSFWLDPQVRFLLTHTSPRAWVRCARERVELSDEAWRGVPWPRRDRWLYAVLVRLLEDYARRHDPLGATGLTEPAAGGPLPVHRHGRLISQDLANAALEAAAIDRLLGGRAPRSVLEIGGGYGRLGYVLLSLYPQATYTVVDIEPALSICRWYLGQLFAPDRLRFLSPDEIDDLGPVDVGVAISSLHEMTTDQVDGYLALLDRIASNVYLKQWTSWRNPVDGITLRFDGYPIPAGWRECYRERAPVQTAFTHAGWTVGRPGSGEH